MAKAKKSGGESDKSGPNPWKFMVSIAGLVTGAFSIPPAPGMTKKNSSAETLRKLVVAPTRMRVGKGDGFVLTWMEEGDAGPLVMTWEPETKEEVAEATRFYEAAHHYEDGPVAKEKRQGIKGKISRAVKKIVSPKAKRSAEEEKLLEVIRADDEHEGPWLAYADWLTGKNDPLAEFLRVVWEIEHYAVDDPARDPLDERWNALIEKHAKDWLAPLAELGLKPILGGGTYYPAVWLLKGLPTEMEIDKPGILPERAAEFFDAAPLVTSLEIELNPFDVPALMKTPEMKQIRHLAIGSAIQSEEDLAALLASPNLTSLRSLELSYWGLTPDAISTLVESKLFGRLESLNLTGCDMTDAAMEVLAASPRTAKLKRLLINNNDIGSDGVKAITQSPHLGKLEELNLGDNSIGDDGAVWLAGAEFLQNLTKLNLENCDIGEDGAAALGKAGFPKMVELELSENPLGAPGIKALLPALAKANIKKLDLDRTELEAAGVEQLTSLTGLQWQELNLNRNNLKAAGMQALANWKQCPPLKRLKLIDNKITDAAIEILAAAPLLATIRQLRLDDNPIGDAGAKALAASPGLGKLKDLFLSPKVGKAGREAIEKRFGKGVGDFT